VSARVTAALVLGLLVAALVATLALTVPWRGLPSPPAGRTPVSAARDFTRAQVARERDFHRDARPPAYLGMAAGLLVAATLGLTPLGARLIGALARPFGGGWAWQVGLGALALSLIGSAVGLPFGVAGERVLRRYGLSTQTWGSWALDAAKSFGIGTGLTLAVLLGLYALIRHAPTTWWAWAAAASAGLVVALSFAYPILIEPAFNHFTPLPAGELRTSLLDLARRDHVPVRDVLVADASRRTTALNAYVSGFGATRRIVVYDTLLKQAPAPEVHLIVAHELGHAKRNDVLYGTAIGALSGAAACCLAYLLVTWPRLLRQAGVSGVGDGRSVALLLALAAIGGLLSLPAQSLLSRRIEARADVHSLDLTGDPATFIASEQRLALTNLSDLQPNPVVYALFFTHPSGPERIAVARDWQQLHRG